MLAVTGLRTTTVRALAELTAETPMRINGDLARPGVKLEIPFAYRYVLAAGVLHGKKAATLTMAEAVACMAVNFVNVCRITDQILERVVGARVCIVGSQSSITGSFDELYAMTKAGVDAYVQTKPVPYMAQLCCVQPPIIRDSGMTQRRHDFPHVLELLRETVTAKDVAATIQDVMWRRPLVPGEQGTFWPIARRK